MLLLRWEEEEEEEEELPGLAPAARPVVSFFLGDLGPLSLWLAKVRSACSESTTAAASVSVVVLDPGSWVVVLAFVVQVSGLGMRIGVS